MGSWGGMGEEEAVPIRNMLACGDTCVLSRASLGFAAGPVRLSKRGVCDRRALWLGTWVMAPLATSTPCHQHPLLQPLQVQRGSGGTRQPSPHPCLFPQGWSWWCCSKRLHWLEVEERPLPHVSSQTALPSAVSHSLNFWFCHFYFIFFLSMQCSR